MIAKMLQNNSLDKATNYTRTLLAAQNSSLDEKWLQELLFANPDLIPIQEINPGTLGFVPVCRELSIPKSGSSVFLDIFGITALKIKKLYGDNHRVLYNINLSVFIHAH